MTKRKWVVLAFGVTTILALLGLGFAAMSINPPWTVPNWTPIAFFILAGLVFFTTVVYLMWDILVNLRIQSPVFTINQRDRTNIVGTIKDNKFVPKRLEHDEVLWEEARSWNSYYAKGPLCPKDYTPLAIKHGNRMDTEIKDDFLIQRDGFSQLICPECNGIYTLGASDKRIRESRSEATSRFEGMRRRENYQ